MRDESSDACAADAQYDPTLSSAAWPIASLQDSLSAAKCSFAHTRIRLAPGRAAAQCWSISALQASRTAAVRINAVWHCSWKSWKCASIHSARALRCGCAAWQNFVASRIQAAMTVTYYAKAEGIESCSNNAKVKALAM